MTMSGWFGTGCPTRGTPAPRRGSPRAWGLIVLALAGLVQSGCQSGACGPCGKFKQGMGNLRERVFPGRASSACCGGAGGISEAPMEFGTPAVVIPPPEPGGFLPAPSDSIPDVLEPAAPTAKPSSPSDASPSQGSRSSAGKAHYEAYRPRSRVGTPRGENIARALIPNSAPTTRSAQSSAVPEPANPLDNLPPLDLPKEIGRDQPGAGAAAVPESAPPPDAATLPGASAKPEDPTDPAVPRPVPAAEVKSAAPGIRLFVAVEPKLAGGSLPTTAGLDWLAEKGYKTILDLRESGDLPTSYASEVTSRGLRYVALPISLKTVDSKHLDLFSAELTLSEARPLYFCDTNGDRAGVLWYLRRITVDKVDPEDASREAREMGLRDKELWLAASGFLEGLKPAKSEPALPPPVGEPAAEKPADLKPAVAPPTSALEPTLDVLNAAIVAAMELPAAEEVVPEEWDGSLRDSTAWRPLAALMLTGLGAPLAYWGRSGFPIRSLARASLPAPVHRPKSLPGVSGE